MMMGRLTLLFMWSVVLALAGEMSSAASRPNIVFMMADDLGWADVGFHGSPIPTPHLDSLVRDGVRLDRNYVNSICSVSRSALMTGVCTVRTGVTNHTPLPLKYRLLPALLRDAGYQTWMCGKWHLGGQEDPAQLPHARGFDHFYGHLHGAIDYFAHTNPETGEPDWQRNGVQVKEDGYSIYRLADEAIKMITSRDPQRPFFLYLAFNGVHGPLGATPELLAKFSAVPDKKLRSLRAAVSGIDEGVGRILAALDRLALNQNTLVVFCSDNGGLLSQQASNLPLRGEKGQPWEGGVRSASAIRWPGQLRAGSVSVQLMWIGDWLPTLATVAKIAPASLPPALDGVDMWPSLSQNKHSDRPMFFVGAGGMAAFDNDWKLVIPERHAAPALFHITVDPNETTDMAAKEPERLARMLKALRAVESSAPPKSPDEKNGGKKIKMSNH